MYFHFGRKKIRCHETTIIYTCVFSCFNKRLSITQICMRTNIQLHYYATISMKVTILNAVRHTLPCFHLTVKRKQSLISVILLNRDISPNFPRNFDYRTRDHMYFFFKHIVTILPFQIYVNSATYETFCVQLRGRTTVYVCHSDS